MKKFLFLALFIIINLAGLYFIYINYPYVITYKCIFTRQEYQMSLGLLTLIIALIAEFAGFIYALFLQSNITKLYNAYQKRSENMSVKCEEDSAKIRALEAKIETLETALQSALNQE